MEVLEGIAVAVFLVVVVVALWWGNSVGVERMMP
jgi:hypothetical protein